MAEVIITLNGICYHKVLREHRYSRSVCGILDSRIWDIFILPKEHWFIKVKGLRPCKRCYPDEKYPNPPPKPETEPDQEER